MGLQHYTQDMSKIPLKYHLIILCYTKYTHPTLICRGTDTRTDGHTDAQKIFTQYLPQLRRAPIVKVLYKQANIGFAAEAVFFWGGERGRFAQKKGVTLLPRATDF